MELPAWEDCCVAETEERATALEAFIYCNEPAGEEEVEQFRSMLLAVLEEATYPGCEAAARELADLKSDKAWANKLSAENADELSNLRREHDDLRARLAAEIDKMDTTAMEAYAEGQSEVVSAMQPHLDELRALLAETEGKK